MTIQDGNDGDLFGTHAAWPVEGVAIYDPRQDPTQTLSGSVIVNWPTDAEASSILDFDALNAGLTFSPSEPITGIETDFAVVPTDDGDHAAVRSGVPIPQDYAEGAALLNAAAQDFATGGEVEGFVEVEEDDDAKARRITEEVQIWQEAKEASTAAVEREREARKTLSATLFPNPKKGTQRFELPAGWKVKLVHGWNYNLGERGKVDDSGLPVSIYDQAVELEAKIAALGSEGSLLAPRIIKWTPTLVEAEYLRMSGNQASEVDTLAKELIDEVLTVTEKTPTLELEPPKAPK